LGLWCDGTATALIIIDQGEVPAFSRHGRDWTGPYRRVVEAAGKLTCQAAILYGEIIVRG
jgi:ATP-dependent DNA ligase